MVFRGSLQEETMMSIEGREKKDQHIKGLADLALKLIAESGGRMGEEEAVYEVCKEKPDITKEVLLRIRGDRKLRATLRRHLAERGLSPAGY